MKVPLENPSEESLYRRWDVVLSTDSDPSNRATWVITDRTSGGSASGTLLFSYSDTGADELKNIYSADVFLNNKDGAKITALSPGTANKKVGVEYGYYPVYYRYWYDDPNDSAGAEEVGWVEENSAGEAIYVLLNGANTESFH